MVAIDSCSFLHFHSHRLAVVTSRPKFLMLPSPSLDVCTTIHVLLMLHSCIHQVHVTNVERQKITQKEFNKPNFR